MKREQLQKVIEVAIGLDGFSFKLDLQGAHLLDEEGEHAVKLDDDFVDVLRELAAKPPLDGNIGAILRQVFLAHVSSNERAFKRGERFGRAAVVANAHELLGIGRIVEAMGEIRTAIDEVQAAVIRS